MRVGFFIREAIRSIRRSAIPSLAAMASVLITMLVLGVFIPIVQATTGAANEVRERILVDVYLEKSSKNSDVERVRRLINDDTPHVKSVQFISKEEALEKKRKEDPDIYRLLGTNPFEDLFRITPQEAEDVEKIKASLIEKNAGGKVTYVDRSIEDIRDRKDDTKKILTATSIVKLVMTLLAILLMVASILLISNTIRLSLFARRREVEVMKLVGATDWFIRWPFIIEGVILGALGGILAILLVIVGKYALIDPLAADFPLFAGPDTVNFGALIAILLVASIGISVLGSILSLRRFLKV